MRKREDIEALEESTLAPYAMKSNQSTGREHEEPPHESRTCYQRDRDRIVHCEAFRKLEYKTQVFVIIEGDYYRTRLTHTIEVAQIARTTGRNLRLNEDLIEAIALAHDLGHPPFGHAGEEILNDLLKEKGLPGFNHNHRSYEIVSKYEKRYPEFDGLNLTREVLIGILKHKTLYDEPAVLEKFTNEGPSLEAQVVDIADSLAYLNHDVDDGLTSGCIIEQDLLENELWQKALKKIKAKPAMSPEILKYQIVKELIDMQVKDLLTASYERLKQYGFRSSSEIRRCIDRIIDFSPEMMKHRNHLQNLLNKKFYHHYRVERMTSKARRIIQDLFNIYKNNPNQLPDKIYPRDRSINESEKYKIIANHIASMTDRYALDEHKKFFDPYERV
ncbi:MAG: hypothetical protein A2Z88_05895 [Omnitrophica WOR_2 bacterium GWA2_47_8]|nr:MAG: hypothetical protein A2Z88_05895 [Omnitrophica WOR_2 bacterium GWA2_47_8]